MCSWLQTSHIQCRIACTWLQFSLRPSCSRCATLSEKPSSCSCGAERAQRGQGVVAGLAHEAVLVQQRPEDYAEELWRHVRAKCLSASIDDLLQYLQASTPPFGGELWDRPGSTGIPHMSMHANGHTHCSSRLLKAALCTNARQCL